MLNEEINLILVGDTRHELPYYQRKKADIRIAPDPDLGYTFLIRSRYGLKPRELQDVKDALQYCSRRAPHPVEA